MSTLAVGAQSARGAGRTDTPDLSEPFRRRALRPDPPTGIIGRWVERVRGLADQVDHAVDGRRISFSFETLIKAVVFSLSIGAAMWASNSSIRSDVRVILTRMDAKVELDSANAKLNDERLASIRAEMADMRRRIELLQFENQQLKETILKAGR